VSSIEVEDCLYQHPAVAEVAVIGVPDEKWGETIKALVVVSDGAEVTEAELIEHCRSRMAHFKAPTSVEIRDTLVRTATGKLQKYSCASRTGKVARARSTDGAPNGPTPPGPGPATAGERRRASDDGPGQRARGAGRSPDGGT